ncbi:probable peptidoglycan muropeptide transporter SLC46 [Drosophila tropicalis]|uniref:probable peptidoglycan muropeptide transporter SLC46 n=1 Tax=Drosophila tropicalis TaxID=46794 RepID=UPI0035ABA99A
MPSSDEAPLVTDNGQETETEILQPSSSTSLPKPSLKCRLQRFALEPAIFMVLFARYLMDAVYQNQILYQTCVTIMEYNASVCRPFLGIEPGTEDSKKIEVKVQTYSANIMLASSLLESCLPAVLSLFLGPWSDKFGRRPILLSIFIGYLSSSIILIILTGITSSTNISPWLYLLSSVPSVLSGGTCTLITIMYCYVSDVATDDKRPMRMVLMEAMLGLGILGGLMSSGYIYAATNAMIIYTISCSILVLGVVHLVFFVPESIKPENIHTGSRIREFFRLDLVKDLINTSLKKRENYDRLILWLTITALTVSIFSLEGESTLNYMFMRQKFDWTVKDYSVYNVARIVIQVVGSILAMVILRRFMKISVVSMAMVALACSVLESTVRGTAVYAGEMYLALFLGMMRGVLGPMCKAILSHVTPSSEFGKIFALATSLQSLSPVAASPLYTSVYKATVGVYSGAFNFISVGLYFLGYVLMAIIFGIQKSTSPSNVYQAIG